MVIGPMGVQVSPGVYFLRLRPLPAIACTPSIKPGTRASVTVSPSLGAGEMELGLERGTEPGAEFGMGCDAARSFLIRPGILRVPVAPAMAVLTSMSGSGRTAIP